MSEKVKSFITGIGSTFAPFGTGRSRHLSKQSPQEVITEAWLEIGQDLWDTYRSFENDRREREQASHDESESTR